MPPGNSERRGKDCSGNGSFSVNRLAQCIHNTANQILTNRYRYNLTGTLYGVTLFDAVVTSQNNDGHSIFFQILSHSICAIGEFHQFARHTLFQTGGFGNAITDQDYHTGLAGLDLIFVVFDLTTN